jgi:hypothetical protein
MAVLATGHVSASSPSRGKRTWPRRKKSRAYSWHKSAWKNHSEEPQTELFSMHELEEAVETDVCMGSHSEEPQTELFSM